MLTSAATVFDTSTLVRTYHRIVADGDVATVLQTTTATTYSGTRYENEYVFAYECRDRMIDRIVEHADSLRAARTLGLV